MSIAKWISEPDSGIYEAMNKAVKLATGEIVGILNADDFYASESILPQVASEFEDREVDAIFGDVVFVDPLNLKKVVRTYSSARWTPSKFAWGFMPAHPTVFIRRKFYNDFGLFKTNYKIAADYELMIRFFWKNRLRYKYLPIKMVIMRRGGVSTKNWRSNVILNNEIIQGCRENGIYTNVFMVYSKYLLKFFELL
jgi:glycosyltransferase involved in cell wall biosynthesis